ncbi:hypothetical protein Ancab_027683 [Ancistrocladus abbreviatus]
MLDLGNLSSSKLLPLTNSPENLKIMSSDPFGSNPFIYSCPINSPKLEQDLVRSINEIPKLSSNDEHCDVSTEKSRILKVRFVRTNHGGRNWLGAEGLEDYVNAWRERRIAAGVPENRCFLPFLSGAPRLVECRACSYLVYPGDGVSCSIRGCQGIYHLRCAKGSLGCSGLKNFKCPQHGCFVCKQKFFWRCIRCGLASHDKCAPWPDKVIHLDDRPGWAICWRHEKDWKLEKKEVFCSLPLPYAEEEFKLDSLLKDKKNQKIQFQEVFHCLPLPYVEEEFQIDTILEDNANHEAGPPPYVHIRRNVYLVKRKRESAYLDIGCTTCTSTCTQDCVCRVQCISCSKTCHCSETCTNRPFRKEKKIKIIKTEHCGWGVEAAESINKGDFIIEYIGEVIDDALCEQRLWDMKYKGVKNFYMCEIQKDFTIDATFKGNASRFLNHGCDPNCNLEKWQVEGETRVGVFAAQAIEIGEPLTYDYRFVQFGPEVKCYCGAANCQGYLGTKRKTGSVDLYWGSKRRRSSVSYLAIVNL